jgi:ribosomal-protein-alanine N-acetyltransferase
MNQIELHTERLILKSITPAIIHELFETKSKEEIINYFLKLKSKTKLKPSA